MRRFRLGFENGARHTNPTVQVLGVFQPPDSVNPFSDPVWGKARALEFLDQGADIVFGCGGKTGNGALVAAAERNQMCIGVDVDQFFSFPQVQSCLVTSAEKKVATAVRQVIEASVRGWPANSLISFDATNGGVGIAPYHQFEDRIPADVKARIEMIKAQLADGSLGTGYTP